MCPLAEFCFDSDNQHSIDQAIGKENPQDIP